MSDEDQGILWEVFIQVKASSKWYKHYHDHVEVFHQKNLTVINIPFGNRKFKMVNGKKVSHSINPNTSLVAYM